VERDRARAHARTSSEVALGRRVRRVNGAPVPRKSALIRA
jgi:hypothetical protein